MRNHNFKNCKDQYPWSFNDTNKQYDAISIIKKNINIRYSLLRYIYSQLFLISLNEKGSFFKPVMFEFPQEKNSYKNIESKVMFGEAFLICTFYEKSEDNKEFELPNSNFNKFPKGKTIINYNDENRIISLSGKLDELHIFLRGGFIVPYQNTFDKYILNSMKLRGEKLNLIVNIDHMKKSKGVLFFDNDGINTIKKGEYIRVNLEYKENVLRFYTNKNKIKKYKFNDHILGSLEFLRINEIMEINEIDKNRKFTINIVYNKDMNKKKVIRNGMFDNHLNKVTFEVSNEKDFISIFDIQEITIN
jgi:alpha-glucosidase (family GH31 glycosyl hydrolase)